MARKRVRYFDLEKIEQDNAALTDTEHEVLQHLAYDPWEEVESQRTVEAWLVTLPPQQRRCAELLQQGLSYRQVAQTLGVSLMRVRQLVAALRKRLTKKLREADQ